MLPSESLDKAKRKSKKAKTFVDSKDTALELASAIAGTVEDKSNKKAAKNRHVAQESVHSDPKPRSASKEKLKQVKNALKAERARAKREKMKARKRGVEENTTSRSSVRQPSASDASSKRLGGSGSTRKRVAFA